MTFVCHLSSFHARLLLTLLSSFISKTNAIPLSADNAVIHAVQPSCTTVNGGSSSCNIGINTVPLVITLNGGYEWLTIRPTTTSESGSILTTNEAIWTAVQTSYLDVKPVTTTATNGATTILTSTEYVSFITTTKTSAGAAPTAIIAAAVIAPALVGTLQPIVDSAGGKTAEAIGSEILSTLVKSGVVLTAEEATQLGSVILAIGLLGTAAEAAHVYQTFPLKSYIANINVAPNPPKNSATASPATSSTSSAAQTVTAIGELPYSDYRDYLRANLIAVGPAPTDDDFASGTTSTTLPSATAKCTQSVVGAAVEVFGALSNKFCTGLDLTKSSSTTLQGSSSGLQGTAGTSIFFNFSQTANSCALGCNASYAQIVKSCEFNSHSIYGGGSLEDSCGTFAMSISYSAPATSTTAAPPPPPIPTPSPPVLQPQHCYGKDDFGSHSDIDGKVQSSWADYFCNRNNQKFTSKTAAVKGNGQSIIYNNGRSPYHYTVSWIEGCVTTATEQDMKQPLGPGSSTVTCLSLLTEDFSKCNNGGAGGTRDAGCLRYNFAATTDLTQL